MILKLLAVINTDKLPFTIWCSSLDDCHIIEEKKKYTVKPELGFYQLVTNKPKYNQLMRRCVHAKLKNKGYLFM